MIRNRVLTILFILAFPVISGAAVQTYSYHPSVERSALYSVTVEGQEQTVLTTDEPDFLVFGASSEVKLDIRYEGEIRDVAVRPVSKNYSYTTEGNVIHLSLSPYDQVSVEVNGDLTKPLFIFVNPIEKAPKFDKNQKVRRYLSGNIYEEGKIELKSGETIYLEPGAIVHGTINGLSTSNVSILGYGILDARVNDNASGIRVRRSRNVRIDGPVMLNATLWTTALVECYGVEVNNYKVIATRSIRPTGLENDGIHLFATSNGRVTKCFSYAHDDAFVCNSMSAKYGWEGEVDNVLFEDCVGWNYRGGNTFEIGYATRKDMSNITYRNVYSIHSNTFPNKNSRSGRGGIGMHHGSNANIRDLVYENVFIEDPYCNAIHFVILKTSYDNIPDWEGGHIDNVVMRNVHVLKQGPWKSEFYGVDESHAIKGLVIDGLYYGDRRVESLQEAGFGRFDYVYDVDFK